MHTRLSVLVGIAPVRRLSVARYLDERVPGVSLPRASLRRVTGAHLMTFGRVDGVRRVVEQM